MHWIITCKKYMGLNTCEHFFNMLTYSLSTCGLLLLGRRVVRLAAGNNYSAAVTADGELFTWGQGAYGRLGHGGLEDVQLPTVVSALAGQRVVDVACGSGDAQTLAVTAEGLVYSWGDGDYGKLGRGGSDGSRVPRFVHNFIDNLENHD